MQVMPVCRIERRAIGDDRPGSVTRKLSELYQKMLRVCGMRLLCRIEANATGENN